MTPLTRIITWLQRMIARFRLWLAMRRVNEAMAKLSKDIGNKLTPALSNWIDAIEHIDADIYAIRTKFALNMPRKHRRGKR